ncbi:Phage small terminase subunit [Bordetella ansorpii]|uniref:Phage small terminase subunit n=1 Tax=Bordetella ansorpii TaxID=288768 RepID=A0A157QP57_9BORD|nr:phage terminase small subunit [Bordetella ansorpii]SAI47398.1 Phage small terminase subunit [Bordetella ansorpii]
MAGLVQRHQMRVAAALAAASTPANAPAPTSGPYELMMHALVNDRRTLKGVQSIERKIELKRGMLNQYGDYVDGVLAADAGGQDEVIVTVMVWLLDTLQFRAALVLAEYVTRHGLTLPPHYNRGVPALLLDEITDAVLAKRVPMDADLLAELQRLQVLTDGKDAPDQARAKLHRVMGETLAQMAGDLADEDEQRAAAAALQHLNRAKQLHSAVGVTKLTEQLERKIKKAEGGAPPQEGTDGKPPAESAQGEAPPEA